NTATASSTNAASVNDNGTIPCQIPVIAIVKTPDGATITASATATRAGKETNNGPGTATCVTISDPLPHGGGGGVTWSNATPNCSVTGAVGAQTLNCTVGTLAQGGSFTAAVTAPTTRQTCAQMNNTATASATNAASVNDPGSIGCQIPVIAIVKTPDGTTITA